MGKYSQHYKISFKTYYRVFFLKKLKLFTFRFAETTIKLYIRALIGQEVVWN